MRFRLCNFIAGLTMAMTLATLGQEKAPIRFSPIGVAPWIASHPLTPEFPNARALHELAVYQNRIYLGYGDVGANRGPVEIGSYDPAQHRFVSEFLLGSEALGKFKVIDGHLYVPSLDPAHFFNQADYAVRSPDGLWKRNGRIGMLHAYDATSFEGQLIVPGSSRDIRGDTSANTLLWASSDHGLSWEAWDASVRSDHPQASAGRFVYALPYQNRLHFSSSTLDGETSLGVRVRDYHVFKDIVVYVTGTPNEINDAILMTFDGEPHPMGEVLDFTVTGDRLTVLRPGPVLETTTDLLQWETLTVESLPSDAHSVISHHDDLYVGTRQGELWKGSHEVNDSLPSVEKRRSDFFGQAIAMHGSVLAIGAPAAGLEPWNHGQVHVYDGDTELQVLMSPNPRAHGYFGAMLAMSDNWLAVGELERGNEMVHLYARDDAMGLWSWRQTVQHESPVTSVAMRGALLAIGWQADEPLDGKRVFDLYERDGEAWKSVFTETFDPFAEMLDTKATFDGRVAVSEDKVILGLAADPSDNQGQGLAIVYQKDESNDSWGRTAVIQEIEPESSFGQAVAVSARWLVIGAPRSDAAAFHHGTVYVYDRTKASPYDVPAVTLEPKGNGGYFGQSLALDGDQLLVGAPEMHWEERTSGAAYVFLLDSDNELKEIHPSIPGTRGFGISVALGAGQLVVGAESVPSAIPSRDEQITIIDTANDSDYDRLSNEWESDHFANGAEPDKDPDADGQTNLQEFLAGTDPLDRTSVLEIKQVDRLTSDLALTWQAVVGKRYAVLASDSLTGPTWRVGEILVAEQKNLTVAVPFAGKARFYRVTVVR